MAQQETMSRSQRTTLLYIMKCAGVDPDIIASVKQLCYDLGEARKIICRNQILIRRLAQEATTSK